MTSLRARPTAHFGFLDPASLAGLWTGLCLLGSAAALLIGSAVFSC